MADDADDDMRRQQYQHMMAAVHHLVKVLGTDSNSPDHMRKILVDLDACLTDKLSVLDEDDHHEIAGRLESAQQTILSIQSSHSSIWDSDPSVASDYLRAITEVEESIACLGDSPLRYRSRRKDLFDKGQATRQMAMERLQKELGHILVQNKHCFEQDSATSPALPAVRSPSELWSCQSTYEESVGSNRDEAVENVSCRESSSTEMMEEYTMDLIHPDVIPHIKSIAAAMFPAGYGPEFLQEYSGFWQDTLTEYLTMLDFDHFSIEDVLQMDWKYLNSRSKIWCLAMRQFVSIYLSSARRLFDQVLGDQGRTSSECLIEVSKTSLFRLLNFGYAVPIGAHKPEWLYILLNMYEALAASIPDMNSLFREDCAGSSILADFQELLTRLGASAKTIFEELGKYVASYPSTTPYPNGGIHHLTRYIINYIIGLAEYQDTLDSILQSSDSTDDIPIPITVSEHLQSITSILINNLEEKGNLYKEPPLKHIFMMNNIHYMVRKISKSSKITPYFGDDWIRTHMVRYRQHAMQYERETWGTILPLLNVDVKKTGKTALKEKCREFTSAFEDIYKNQTRWCVPDFQLREELRISATRTVILAYRNFVGKVNSSIGEKHIKYNEHELEGYILDLLEGLPKSLNHLRKK